MSKPPMKAIEQIKRYCEKTQCRRCVYGLRGSNDYVGCKLMDIPPCDWKIEEDDE